MAAVEPRRRGLGESEDFPPVLLVCPRLFVDGDSGPRLDSILPPPRFDGESIVLRAADGLPLERCCREGDSVDLQLGLLARRPGESEPEPPRLIRRDGESDERRLAEGSFDLVARRDGESDARRVELESAAAFLFLRLRVSD